MSWGGPGTFPYRFEIGKQRLEEIFGLHIVPTKHALKSAEWIYQNPKVFMGYSDTTVIHLMCFKAGLNSFYAPAVMTAFAENISMHDYTTHGIRKTLFSSDTIGTIPNNTEGWTTALLDMMASRFPEYDQALLKVFEKYEIPIIPIVTTMDFGHSDPMWTLPYGAMTEINPDKKTVTILENGVI